MADTDRKLLELAAKAAGARLSDYTDGTPDHWTIQNAQGIWVKWSPLTDDGDALRLAVKLYLDIHVDSNLTDVIYLESATEAHFDDPYAATRRAIVRAAAQIGRAM